MAGINVVITDATGTQTHRVEIPHDVPMQRLIPRLVQRLGGDRPIIGSNGQLNSYRLYFANREIGQDETLADVGVSEGSTLTLSREGQAGASVASLERQLYIS